MGRVQWHTEVWCHQDRHAAVATVADSANGAPACDSGRRFQSPSLDGEVALVRLAEARRLFSVRYACTRPQCNGKWPVDDLLLSGEASSGLTIRGNQPVGALRFSPCHALRPKAPVISSNCVHFLHVGRAFGMGRVVSMGCPHLLRPLTADWTCCTVGGSSEGIKP